MGEQEAVDIMRVMDPAELPDEELVRRCQACGGEQRRALADALFERYYAKVGRWCYRFTGETEAAADVAQEVFLKAFRHLGTFEGGSKFSTWLYVIARNECFNRAGSAASRFTSEGGDEMLATLPDVAALSPHDQVERQRANLQLRALLSETLDETERRVFTMHYGDDVPLDTVTRVLGLQNASGAKAYIVSAKRKLARAVQRLSARGGRE